MKISTNIRRLITTILQIFFAALLFVYLIVNTVVDVARLKLYYTTVEFDNATQLPSPAFTLCSDNVDYWFECNSYGNNMTNCPGLIRTINTTNDAMYNGWFSKCYVFQTQQPMLFSTPTSPPKNWSAFQSPLFIRYSFFNASTISKMQLMIWNPFDLPADAPTELSTTATPQVLNPYALTQMDACRERVYTFYWRKHVFLNGTEKWNLDWRVEFGVSSNAFGTPTSATGVIHFKPGSFEVVTTREHPLLPFLPVFTSFLVLLAALYGTYYAILSGRGKYRTWGIAHIITRYFPQQHIKPPEKDPPQKPTVHDLLGVYLVDIEKAEYENK